IEASKIDVEVFGLDRPVSEERIFHAGAQRPAKPGRGVRAVESAGVGGRLDVAERGAAGDVGQEAVKRVAETAASGAEPGVLGRGLRAREEAAAIGAALDARQREVALDAVNEGAELPVVAQRHTVIEPLRADAGAERRPARAAETVAEHTTK